MENTENSNPWLSMDCAPEGTHIEILLNQAEMDYFWGEEITIDGRFDKGAFSSGTIKKPSPISRYLGSIAIGWRKIPK